MSAFQGLPGYDFCLLTQNLKGCFQLVHDKQKHKKVGLLWPSEWTLDWTRYLDSGQTSTVSLPVCASDNMNSLHLQPDFSFLGNTALLLTSCKALTLLGCQQLVHHCIHFRYVHMTFDLSACCYAFPRKWSQATNPRRWVSPDVQTGGETVSGGQYWVQSMVYIHSPVAH